MQVKKININDLKPFEDNPRFMPQSEADKLEKNIRTFGLVDPIIIDLTDDNTIIGGHQRFEALKRMNEDMTLTLIPLGDIGLVIKDTELHIKDKNDQKALNLALNKISGEWDYSKLDDILNELNEDNYLIELTGFDEEDLISLDDDFTFDLFDTDETDEEEEILPPDAKLDLTGETPRQRYEIILAFNTRESANQFLKETLNITDREITDKTVLLKEGIEFLTTN